MRISDWSSDVCSSDLDRLASLVGGAAVRCLHDRRPAARTDDEVAASLVVARHLTSEPRELARLVIIFGLGLQPPRAVAGLIIGRRLLEPGSGCGFGNGRRNLDAQGGFYLRFITDEP